MKSLLIVALVGAVAFAAEEPKKDAKLTKKEVGKMMKDAHKGDKSAQVLAEAELKKDAPDWDAVTKSAKSFDAMGAAFARVELGYSSPATYIAATKALTKAAGDKDKKAATEAMAALNKSCVACHRYGGAGGALR
jgi:uncharacterized protein (UPF0212 family)